MQQSGGCLCGHIRYRINAELIDAGFCHCSLCRRSSGAPVVAWLTIPAAGLSYTHGQPAAFASSQTHLREFCPHCGTQLAFRAAHTPVTVDVTLGSLDDSDAVLPEYHIWCQNQVSWLHLQDELPRYPDAGPDIF